MPKKKKHDKPSIPSIKGSAPAKKKSKPRDSGLRKVNAVHIIRSKLKKGGIGATAFELPPKLRKARAKLPCSVLLTQSIADRDYEAIINGHCQTIIVDERQYYVIEDELEYRVYGHHAGKRGISAKDGSESLVAVGSASKADLNLQGHGMFTGSGADHVALVAMINYINGSTERATYMAELSELSESSEEDSSFMSPQRRGVLQNMQLRRPDQHTPGKVVDTQPLKSKLIVRQCVQAMLDKAATNILSTSSEEDSETENQFNDLVDALAIDEENMKTPRKTAKHPAMLSNFFTSAATDTPMTEACSAELGKTFKNRVLFP